ncbi:M20/M25/M40 family metallo-hydrolase [Deinococcus aquaticus]|uniref:M20/M25/M40 family metallo-hydrolase n=1 Tax=Deinococcus aquaticus TaxID=328692 RepID=UPI003F488534
MSASKPSDRDPSAHDFQNHSSQADSSQSSPGLSSTDLSGPDSPGAADAHDWFPRTQSLALTLTRWPSVTGTDDETRFGARLRDLLAAWPYFRQNLQDLWLSPVTGPSGSGGAARPDGTEQPLPANVFALVRSGDAADTVVLSGHYDTVGTGPYGPLAELATEPEALTRALIRELERRADPARPTDGTQSAAQPLRHAEALALADLRSGDFLAGRGLLDMKGGVAAGLAVLERYAALPARQRTVNLLLVASPDEENLSRGARSAASQLGGLCAGPDGLRVRLGINLDATNDVGMGADGQAAYLGTVGKVPVTALVVGRATHASYPFDGTSAALIAAELLRRVEGHPDPEEPDPEDPGTGGPDAHTADTRGSQAPPPVCLELRDDRDRYDVTTPAQVWCAFNVLTYRRGPQDVLSQFMTLATHAAQEALGTLAAQAARWGSGSAAGLAAQRALVLSFAQLRALAAGRAGEAAVQSVIGAVPPGPDPLRASRTITQELVALAALEGPAVIVGLGAVYYPHTRVNDELHATLQAELTRFSQQTGYEVQVRPAFEGISDMSFLGHVLTPADQAALAAHTPHPEHLGGPHGTPVAFPTINVGPWGRDYHQKLERIHRPYSFGALPELLWQLLRCADWPSQTDPA